MNTLLTSRQIGNLTSRLVADLQSTNWPKIQSTDQERSVTKHFVAPVVRETLSQLGINRLVLSSDGTRVPKPLIKFGMSFSPDLEIRFADQKCIAFEVKLLRDHDASGSLSKALGQALIYKSFGFERSICVVFDTRKNGDSEIQNFLENALSGDDSISALYLH